MKLENVLTNILQHIPLSAADKEYLDLSFQEVSISKNDLLQKQGDVCRHIYFVNEGILRAFYLSPKGKDTTVMFAKEDWWITDMHSFLNELPALVSIQVIEQGKVLKLSKGKLEEIYQHLPQFNTYFRILIQNAYCREQLRTIQNLSLSAKERYHHFLKKYPEVAGKITLKQMASYLGITPEFLSTIRAEKD